MQRKADNYDRGNSVVAAGFFFMHSDVAVHGRYFYEKTECTAKNHSWE